MMRRCGRTTKLSRFMAATSRCSRSPAALRTSIFVVDLDEQQLRIERNEWQGHISTTKGNRIRYVPMTRRLAEALRKHRHMRGDLVLYRADGGVMTESR
jgi:integrase